MQYVIGLGSFSSKAPMEASLLTWFRKRITPEMLSEINDYIIGRSEVDDDDDEDSNYFDDTPDTPSSSVKADKEVVVNEGTIILDATCIPSDIRFPTDISILNEGRKRLEDIIDEFHKNGLTNGLKPRTYREIAYKDFMRLARNRKPARKEELSICTLQYFTILLLLSLQFA